MNGTTTAEQDADNVIRILVATDNHLGYGEKDAVRGEDSSSAGSSDRVDPVASASARCKREKGGAGESRESFVCLTPASGKFVVPP